MNLFRGRAFRSALAAVLGLAGVARVSGTGAGVEEIVVANRYLQQTGESHAHLYLYRADGKLLRQLTKEGAGQDRDPVFAPDGAAIVFTRQKGAGAAEVWSVEPRGGNLHRLAAPPSWYLQSLAAPAFSSPEPAGMPFDDPPPRFAAPDGSAELILKTVKEDDADQLDQPGHGKHYRLRDPKTNQEVELGGLPGFLGAMNLMFYPPNDPSRRFLIAPPLRVAFFDLHLDSTNGDTVMALDLTRRRFVRLCENWADVIPLPGEPAFLAEVFPRYLPYGDGTHTANCSFMERWDAALNTVRYAPAGAAAVCYGASLYRPGETPPVIAVHSGIWPQAAASPRD